MECDSDLVGLDYVSHALISATSKSDLLSALLFSKDHIWPIIVWWERTLGPSLAPLCSPGVFACVGDKVLPLLPAVTLHQDPMQATRQPKDIQLARTESAYPDSTFSAYGEAQQLDLVQLPSHENFDPPIDHLGDETVDKLSASRVRPSHALLLPETLSSCIIFNFNFCRNHLETVLDQCEFQVSRACGLSSCLGDFMYTRQSKRYNHSPTHSRANKKHRIISQLAVLLSLNRSGPPSVPCRMLTAIAGLVLAGVYPARASIVKSELTETAIHSVRW